MELKTITDLLLAVIIIGLWSYFIVALFNAADKPLEDVKPDEHWPFPTDKKP